MKSYEEWMNENSTTTADIASFPRIVVGMVRRIFAPTMGDLNKDDKKKKSKKSKKKDS